MSYLLSIKRLQVLEKFNVIFELLEDGKWHSLNEIAGKSGLHEFKLEIITNFLAEYDFIELDKAKRKTRLAASVADFLKKIKHVEKAEG